MVFAPLDPNLAMALTERRLQRCFSVAVVRRGHIRSALYLASGRLLEEFENAICVYSDLVSKIESEFARRAVEEALNGTR